MFTIGTQWVNNCKLEELLKIGINRYSPLSELFTKLAEESILKMWRRCQNADGLKNKHSDTNII